jgi:hypothetical protein
MDAQDALARSQVRQLVLLMADSLKRRLFELEQLGHLPENRGVRSAGTDPGADARLMVRLRALEAETQSTLVSMTTQIAELEGKLDALRRARDQLLKQFSASK